MSKIVWLDGDEQYFQLDLSTNMFIVLYSANKHIAATLPLPVAYGDWILEEIKRHFKNGFPKEAKIIGDEKAIRVLETCLRNIGISTIKTHPRSGKQEILFDAATGKLRAARSSQTEKIDGKANTEFRGELSLVKESSATTVSRATECKEKRKKRVYILDDSVTIRKVLKAIFAKEDELEVVGESGNPKEAIKEILHLKPDALTLDIHMPGLNGVEVLRELMPKLPVPTLILSSISISEGPLVLEALNAGAVDYIQKPSFESMAESKELILAKVKDVALAKNVKTLKKPQSNAKASSYKIHSYNQELPLLIGSSTGGTVALEELFIKFPSSIPPTLVVQHIPEVFSKALASRLNDLCPFTVKEAEDNEEVLADTVYIAAGGKQMALRRVGKGLRIKLNDDPPMNRFRPSVDYMFKSFIKAYKGSPGIGIILTGMGKDGAQGLLDLKNEGWQTIGQDESSCVVYGMPRAAREIGAVLTVSSLNDIPKQIALSQEIVLKKNKKRVA